MNRRPSAPPLWGRRENFRAWVVSQRPELRAALLAAYEVGYEDGERSAAGRELEEEPDDVPGLVKKSTKKSGPYTKFVEKKKR